MRSIEEHARAARPIRVMQYGEGNFLRAFADWMIDIANEKGAFNGGVAIVKPIPFGNLDAFEAQECAYTVLLRGKQGGETVSSARLVTSVADAIDCYSQYARYAALAKSPELRFVISNTTEAGIAYDAADELSFEPPKSYPGKLTKFLYERFIAFGGDHEKGLIILPVELIERNGQKLRECCERLAERWGLPADFIKWLGESNVFCQTLVDRIVTGYPRDEIARLEADLGYGDKLLVTGEPFALWVIESDKPELVKNEFPLDKAGLPVVFTDDLKPYRERKVRLLNGAHTSTVLAAYLSGLDTVGELMADETMRALIERSVYQELAPHVPLPEDEVRAFADSVMERFENPYIRHMLLSISLNSISKFKARVLPTIKETHDKTGSLPDALCFSLAALMAFYSGDYKENGRLFAKRADEIYEIMDDAPVLEFFAKNHGLPADQFALALLRREDFWGEDLSKISGFTNKTADYLNSIRSLGMRSAVRKLLGEA